MQPVSVVDPGRWLPFFWQLPVCLWLLLMPLAAGAGEGCLVGFDVGSSGVRAGADHLEKIARVKIDYLEDVWPDNRIDVTNEASIAAFRELPKEIGVSGSCAAVAGGYSAWRHAMEKGRPTDVAATLATFRQRTGVHFFVIPQEVEGGYAYLAAQRILKERLQTPFVLDIGGGSMQFASLRNGWGAPLGQKSWRKRFCQSVKQLADPNCAPNPVGEGAWQQTIKILDQEVTAARERLGKGLRVTAISSTVVREIHPVLRLLAPAGGEVDENGFGRRALAEAIRRLSTLDDAGILAALDNCRSIDARPTCDPGHVATFVTDMLLLHAFLEGLSIDRIEVGAADVNNVPGILADTRPRAWIPHYQCYLTRLQSAGIGAFLSDPGTCPPER
ncbi:MAG: hypothetical protein HQL96_09915 [Magnetococcales bacterium]|nr:hypothetical protein [Magnetococcales bacterium]